MSVAIALFTRDLRVHDNPVLHAACRAATEVVPLFVLDKAIINGRSMSANRAVFLADGLADLDAHLRDIAHFAVCIGARHFFDLLVGADVANNQLNWQWVAGTGTDTRLDPPERATLDYPDPVIDLRDGADYFRTARDKIGGEQ